MDSVVRAPLAESKFLHLCAVSEYVSSSAGLCAARDLTRCVDAARLLVSGDNTVSFVVVSASSSSSPDLVASVVSSSAMWIFGGKA